MGTFCTHMWVDGHLLFAVLYISRKGFRAMSALILIFIFLLPVLTTVIVLIAYYGDTDSVITRTNARQTASNFFYSNFFNLFLLSYFLSGY